MEVSMEERNLICVVNVAREKQEFQVSRFEKFTGRVKGSIKTFKFTEMLSNLKQEAINGLKSRSN